MVPSAGVEPHTINAVNSTGAQPPPPSADPRPGHYHFFASNGKFPGVETLQLSNPPAWGQKNRANSTFSVNTATLFIDHTVE